MTEFKYAPMFQLGKDETEYRLISKEGITGSPRGTDPIGARGFSRL